MLINFRYYFWRITDSVMIFTWEPELEFSPCRRHIGPHVHASLLCRLLLVLPLPVEPPLALCSWTQCRYGKYLMKCKHKRSKWHNAVTQHTQHNIWNTNQHNHKSLNNESTGKLNEISCITSIRCRRRISGHWVRANCPLTMRPLRGRLINPHMCIYLSRLLRAGARFNPRSTH